VALLPPFSQGRTINAAHGNVLDLWAAVQGLPLYEAALHLAETFGLRRNREEEPVKGTR